MEEGKLHNQGRKLLFSELFKGRAEDKLPSKVPTVSDPRNLTITRAGSVSSDIWSSGSSVSATTPCSVLGSELSSITTDSEDDEDDTDLIDELNRQMADYMLHEDDGDGGEILLVNRERILEKEKGFGDNCGRNCEERKERLSDQWRNGEEEDGGGGRSRGRNLLQLQPQILQNGSAIRGSGPNTASSGTGFFLPRGITPVSRPSDHRRKKSGCSTVLIPARVLQVLQQHHFANSNIIPNYTHYPFVTGYNAMPTSNEVILQQKQPPQQQQQQHGEQHLEVSLPKEWIY